MNIVLLKLVSCFFLKSAASVSLFYQLNFTADISIEAWQTADDITDNTDEIQEESCGTSVGGCDGDRYNW